MNEKGMQHGRNWNGHKINGYIATEKYDGCRAFWDGENLWSRGGIKINLPDSWRAVLPLGIPLDGEIYDGIDGLYRCGAAIKYGNFTASMRFMIFDCPTAEGDYPTRLEFSAKYTGGPLQVISYRCVKRLSDVKLLLVEVLQRGGEGLMLRNPKLKYAPGRTAELLKFKNIM